MNAMHIGKLELTQIRLLAELSHSYSVSRAAHRIGISQSAASHSIAKLRKKLGDPLFIRTRDGFQPTPYGAQLCEASSHAVEALTTGLTSQERFDPLTTTRVFRFFMNEIGQTVFLPALLRFLQTNAPGASTRVLPIPLDNPGAALSSGQVDFAAGFFNNLTTGIFQSLVFRDRYACIVRARHPKFPRAITRKQASHAPANFSAAGRASPPVRRSPNALGKLSLGLRIDRPSPSTPLSLSPS
jgi:DNA-binding transcriptional LysR family regulator